MQFATTADEVTALTDEALARADELLDGAVTTTDPTWSTVLAPLDEIAAVTGEAYGRGAFLGQVHDDPDLRDVARACGERLSQWGVRMVFRDDLHAAVEAYAATDEAAALTGERARLLAFVRRDLRRAGHGLDPEARAEMQRHSERLVQIGVEFQRNVADDDNRMVVGEDDLDGLPASYVAGLGRDDDGGYVVTMAYPDVLPFMDRSERRDLRQQLDRLYNTRAVEQNRPLLAEAVRLRARIAELMGQPSWAHHQLEVKMAGKPDAVEAFYADLLPPLTDAGRADVAVMQRMLAEETGEDDVTVQRWDWRYLHARRQREEHGLDAEEVAAHFALEPTLDGLLELCSEVFGLVHEPVDVPTWHDEVRSFRVSDAASGEPIATVHMDLHPRPGTYGHAAAFTLRPGRALPDGSYQQPVSAIVCNFPRPTGDQPALLPHPQVETLFHEYGHILHQVLTRAELVRFSGTSVERDFVEAPSQIMEHWTWDADVLARFARHHATGEPIPAGLVEAMTAARNLDVALTTLRQVQFGWLDLQLHGPGGADRDLDEVTAEAADLALLPKPDDTFFPAGFGHILGGYDAGYYGYLWSDVIGDDMFRRFREEGVTSPQVGADYRREILEAGGTRDASELVRRFLGREPDNSAFLEKLGIG